MPADLRVLIRGDGVAACCCAHLLRHAGFPVTVEPLERPRLPVILLGDQALALVRDIFDQPELFANEPRIRRRVVAWGDGADPVSVEHSAVVVSEELLLRRVTPGLLSEGNPTNEAEASWKILTARPLPVPAVEYSFGARLASVRPASLAQGTDPSACWIESLDNGWLFLIPGADRAAWLLAIGDSPEALLNHSRVVAEEIAALGGSGGGFPAYPRIASPLCAPGWVCCGSAAMAFDPICGDGTAHAIREAILAAALIRGVDKGAPVEELLTHYETRLTAGFRRHLTVCRQFYSSGGEAIFWTSEAEAIARGIDWCDSRLSSYARFRYQLRGFELEAVC